MSKRLLERYDWVKKYCTGRKTLILYNQNEEGLGIINNASAVTLADMENEVDLELWLSGCIDNEYDIIVAMDVIELVDDANYFIEECRRVCKNNVFISTANKDAQENIDAKFNLAEIKRLCERHLPNMQWSGQQAGGHVDIKARTDHIYFLGIWSM